jgi:hypothetical protein
MKGILSRALAYAKERYNAEPAVVNAAVLAVLVAVGVPVVIGGVSVAAVVAPVLAILLGGVATRRKVTPVD